MTTNFVKSKSCNCKKPKEESTISNGYDSINVRYNTKLIICPHIEVFSTVENLKWKKMKPWRKL